MPTIKDVANLANVSVTTVSRILNNRGYIGTETRKKVEEAMAQLNYFPNQIARSLQKNQSFIIGMIVPDSNNPFFSEIIKFVELYANQQNYKILLCNSLNEPEKEERYLNMLRQNRVDGIIMCSHTIDIEAYKRIKLPIITFDRVISDQHPFVACDNFKGGEMATEHLIKSGCKSLLHVSGPLRINLLPNKRTDGFTSTCKKYGVPYTIIEGSYENLITENARSFLENEVLEKLHQFDGVFCSSDLLAYLLYIAATDKGMKVPEELKIVGFDNHSFTRMLETPKITTIAQPFEKIGKILSSTIVSMIEDKESKFNNTIVNVELIKGETT